MAKDLRSFIQLLRNRSPNDFHEIGRRVDPRLEITAIISKLEKAGRYPLLYFKEVKGSSIPLVTNVCIGYKRFGMAMGLEEAFEYDDYFSYSDKFAQEYIKRKSEPIPPKKVDDGPCKEVVMKGGKIDVRRLPVPTTSPADEGPYITAGITVCQDPERPEFPNFNLGIYRLKLIERNRVGLYYSWGKYMHHLHRKAEESGKPLDVAVFIGYHPAYFCACTDQAHLTEYSLAGSLMREPVPLVKCETNGIYVPATSEIVIEGKLLPKVRQKDGPFGEYPGYYGNRVDAPVVEVTCVTMRRRPIYYYVPGGKHAEHLSGGLGYVMDATAELKKYYPTVRKVHRPWQLSYYVFIQMKKVNEGDAISAGLMAVSLSQLFKYAIVVDDDINVFDEKEVMWAAATRSRPDEDFVIIPRAKGNRLDPTTYTRLRNERDSMTTKLVIDATAKTGVPYETMPVIREPMVDEIDLSTYGFKD